MKRGILKVRKTKRGKIFVQIDRLNGKPPMPLSYVRFKDTSLNDKECTYEIDKKGLFVSISVGGKVVWKRAEDKRPARRPNNNRQNNQKTPNKKEQGFKDSFSIKETLLPKDIRETGIRDIDNFALKFNKAARYDLNHRGDNYKFWFFKNDYRSRTKLEIVPNYGHIDFEAIIERQNKNVQTTFPNNNRNLQVSLQWRMVIGLGGESVYETGMTLHPIYGIPYIPSSSIKGIVRSWIINQLFEATEVKAITSSKLFCTLFGCPKEIKDGNRKVKSALKTEHQGTLRFFDAFPNKPPKLKTDIMNVHYKDWYKEIGYKPPTDTQMPNPIPFLTLDKSNNLAFVFNIGINQNQKLGSFDESHLYLDKTTLTDDNSILDFTSYWLKSALQNHGIGAKTAVGYGYFNE